MSKHYIIRVGDSVNFKNSSDLGIWAVKSRCKTFLQIVKEGDKLWFVKNKVKNQTLSGKIIAVADFVSKNERVHGPLLSLSLTNEELGWNEKGEEYDIEINYNNLYNLSRCNLFTGQKGQTTIMDYDKVKESLMINLVVAYENITIYSKISRRFTNNIK
jgi:hypothetical protein